MHVTTQRLVGVNGSAEQVEAGEPISLADVKRLGYAHRPELAWRSMLDEGAIVELEPTSKETQGEPAAPGVAWELGPATSSWRGWSPERALAESLAAAERLDARRAAARAPAGSPPSGSSPAAPAPAPAPDPSRSWVRP